MKKCMIEPACRLYVNEDGEKKQSKREKVMRFHWWRKRGTVFLERERKTASKQPSSWLI